MVYPRMPEVVREKRYEILDILAGYHALGTFIDDVGVVVMGRVEENKFRMTVTERPTQRFGMQQ
jgi:hypothetical protein